MRPELKWMLLAVGPLVVLVSATCALEMVEEPYVDHEEGTDLVEVDGRADGVGSTFDRHAVLSDTFFTDTDMLSTAGLQTFFESTPYGRSWLADYSVDGQSAARAIVDASRDEEINPVVMVARMQVEKSLVSRSSRPSSSAIDYGFGCGCPDGGGCSARYRGLAKQIRCAAGVLRRHYDGSRDGTGQWRRGRAGSSLDGYSITPRNHSTASLYAYTPWVLPNRGGNWLVWNVTRRFYNHMDDLGVIHSGGGGDVEPDPSGECSVGGVEGSCIHVDDCPSYTHETTRGLCGGTSSIRCCTPVTCESAGRSGRCLTTSACDDSTHEEVPGLCPGPSAVRCCVARWHDGGDDGDGEDGDDGAGCGADPGERAFGNDSSTAATPLSGVLDGTALAVCESDDDYFSIDLAAGESLSIDVGFDHEEVDVDVRLTGPVGTAVTGNSMTDDEVIDLDRAPASGTYLLRVYAYARSGTYTLVRSAP